MPVAPNLQALLLQARLQRQALDEQAARQAMLGSGQNALRYMAMQRAPARAVTQQRSAPQSASDKLIAEEQALRARSAISSTDALKREKFAQESQNYRSELANQGATYRQKLSNEAAMQRQKSSEEAASKRAREARLAARSGRRRGKHMDDVKRIRQLQGFFTTIGEQQPEANTANWQEAVNLYENLPPKYKTKVANPTKWKGPAVRQVLTRMATTTAAKTPRRTVRSSSAAQLAALTGAFKALGPKGDPLKATIASQIKAANGMKEGSPEEQVAKAALLESIKGLMAAAGAPAAPQAAQPSPSGSRKFLPGDTYTTPNGMVITVGPDLKWRDPQGNVVQ